MMTEKYKILGKYIKDLSSETKDVETYLFVRDNIFKYQLGIDITSKAIKNKMIEVNTTLKFEDKEKSEFLHEMGQSESGLDRLTKTGYTLLGLQTYFTAGPQEVRAWTINVGDTAPKAAGKIHGDFEKGFIRAETISFADFIENDGEKGAKESGKLKTEGKDYIVQDGDVLHFLFNS